MRNPFRRKPKVHRVRFGDQIFISVGSGGVKYVLALSSITATLNGPTVAEFKSLDAHMLHTSSHYFRD